EPALTIEEQRAHEVRPALGGGAHPIDRRASLTMLSHEAVLAEPEIAVRGLGDRRRLHAGRQVDGAGWRAAGTAGGRRFENVECRSRADPQAASVVGVE